MICTNCDNFLTRCRHMAHGALSLHHLHRLAMTNRLHIVVFFPLVFYVFLQWVFQFSLAPWELFEEGRLSQPKRRRSNQYARHLLLQLSIVFGSIFPSYQASDTCRRISQMLQSAHRFQVCGLFQDQGFRFDWKSWGRNFHLPCFHLCPRLIYPYPFLSQLACSNHLGTLSLGSLRSWSRNH